MGDGCNMEGISSEAASLAGHWGLGKLIALYDDNRISIDGHTDISFTEDVSARYEAMGWHVQHVTDGNTDLEGLRRAIEAAKAVTDKPSLIKVSTLIGYGSPNKADTHDVHGAPLGASETAATRENLKWPYGEFEVPREAYDEFGKAAARGAAAHKEWEEKRKTYAAKYPEEYAEFEAISSGAPCGPVKWLRRPAVPITAWGSSHELCLLMHVSQPAPCPAVCPPLQASCPLAGRRACPSSPALTRAWPHACTVRPCSTRWRPCCLASWVALPIWRPPT